MLGKDRVRAAFEKTPSDKAPIYQSGFSSRVASLILGREAYVGGGIQQFREARSLWDGPDAHAEFLERSIRDAIDVSLALNLDLVRPMYWRSRTRPSQKIDDLTFRWDHPGGGRHVMRFDPERELFPEIERVPGAPVDFDALEEHVEAIEAGAKDYAPADEIFLEVERAIEELGATHAVNGFGAGCNIPYHPEIWLEATLLRPDLVARRLDVYVKEAAAVIPRVTALGTPYLFGGGDFASNQGPFFSPAVFRELVLPRLKEIAKICQVNDAYYLFASDGNLWPVARMLFGESGVDGFYEMDVLAGMDPKRLRETFPHLTLLGGVNSRTVHLGPPETIREEVRCAMDTAHEHGGMIVGCSNQIVVETPIEHVHVMMEEMEKRR